MVEQDWRQRLTPEQYRVCREGGTEPPFSHPLNAGPASGSYHCVACGALLFQGAAKFDSGSGWPSFREAATPEALREHTDHGHGMTRTEVRCAGCDSHLGHVFPDGPPPTGLRYCINGVCLDQRPPVGD